MCYVILHEGGRGCNIRSTLNNTELSEEKKRKLFDFVRIFIFFIRANIVSRLLIIQSINFFHHCPDWQIMVYLGILFLCFGVATKYIGLEI